MKQGDEAKPVMAYRPLWRLIICKVIGHFLLGDFDGNTFCWRCNRRIKGKARMTAAKYLFGNAGQRQLERERKP